MSDNIPLTNDTISRRNSYVAENMNKQLIEEISNQQPTIQTDETTCDAENLRLIKCCYIASLVCGIAQYRKEQILPSIGILLGAIPVLAITVPMRPKKHV
jgi:hypothetical protein